ncbi:LpqB family beta-propeller domain-containing protein [Saccharomonospora glauca]|uniref:Sporulation/spore germination protein n=1 Tax=Saccharomonospora glauca K62 TaxID=928724 RepID=I1D5V1_9PSEU|nr:LpqB family beta-propeller domain-containing protein [Saccharomonospora glauca]EIF00326.1 sporulation/spore germination protein [Saccharomonospora glauca K62]
MRRHRRVSGAALALVLCVLTVTGCAAIPMESQPKAIPQSHVGQPTQEIPEPELGLDPLTVVRKFVRYSVQPANDHAASRAYLSDKTREAWKPDSSLRVIKDEFNTVYAPESEQPDDPNERVVALRAVQIGRLAPDHSFIPGVSDYRKPVRVRKQADGEWRIVDPPDSIVITENDFNRAYFQVPVYFFAPDSTALVSDLRYAVARPQSGLPARVVDLLLSGPSEGLAGAVRNPLGDASLDSNVTNGDDGSLIVPLTGLSDETVQERELMAAQIVRSLQHVTTNRVKLLSDGTPLVPGRVEWQPSDLPAYDTLSSPSAELPGLMTVGGRVRSLGSGAPIDGLAGSGSLNVVSAAQAINGHQLAVVEAVDGQMRLRVGDYGTPGQVVELSAAQMTRPTWKPPVSKDDKSTEVWTVVDGRQVTRVQQDADGQWVTVPVNASELADAGEITALRLSRDGTRAALVAGGKLVVASVVRTASGATLRAPRVLQEDRLYSVVDVDWIDHDTLVAVTSSEWVPVARVSVDGFQFDQYNTSNLTPPMRAVTAAPGRPIVVADNSGLWTAAEIGAVWVPHGHSTADAQPFYPG